VTDGRPVLVHGSVANARRRPDEAEIPLEPLPYPLLVGTGGHEPAFEALEFIARRAP
jgi:hypothetical protein